MANPTPSAAPGKPQPRMHPFYDGSHFDNYFKCDAGVDLMKAFNKEVSTEADLFEKFVKFIAAIAPIVALDFAMHGEYAFISPILDKRAVMEAAAAAKAAKAAQVGHGPAYVPPPPPPSAIAPPPPPPPPPPRGQPVGPAVKEAYKNAVEAWEEQHMLADASALPKVQLKDNPQLANYLTNLPGELKQQWDSLKRTEVEDAIKKRSHDTKSLLQSSDDTFFEIYRTVLNLMIPGKPGTHPLASYLNSIHVEAWKKINDCQKRIDKAESDLKEFKKSPPSKERETKINSAQRSVNLMNESKQHIVSSSHEEVKTLFDWSMRKLLTLTRPLIFWHAESDFFIKSLSDGKPEHFANQYLAKSIILARHAASLCGREREEMRTPYAYHPKYPYPDRPVKPLYEMETPGDYFKNKRLRPELITQSDGTGKVHHAFRYGNHVIAVNEEARNHFVVNPTEQTQGSRALHYLKKDSWSETQVIGDVPKDIEHHVSEMVHPLHRMFVGDGKPNYGAQQWDRVYEQQNAKHYKDDQAEYNKYKAQSNAYKIYQDRVSAHKELKKTVEDLPGQFIHRFPPGPPREYRGKQKQNKVQEMPDLHGVKELPYIPPASQIHATDKGVMPLAFPDPPKSPLQLHAPQIHRNPEFTSTPPQHPPSAVPRRGGIASQHLPSGPLPLRAGGTSQRYNVPDLTDEELEQLDNEPLGTPGDTPAFLEGLGIVSIYQSCRIYFMMCLKT